MSRLIDADKLTEAIKNELWDWETVDGITATTVLKQTISDISNQPTVDAEPVRHGRWVDQYDDGDWHCSVCGAIVEKDEQDRHNWYRCYHCGAKMDEVTE